MGWAPPRRRHPYARHFRKQVTLRLGADVIAYFKALAEETGVPYQNLINLYLSDRAHSGAYSWANQPEIPAKIGHRFSE
jgi:uncharacterized protein (DUF4415 family)